VSADPESGQFIAWALAKLDDPDFYHELLREIPRKVANYYSYPKPVILSALTAKLRQGAAEHGAPVYPQEQIYQELQAEYLDLIGWTLLAMYQHEREHTTGDPALE
jgi:hypothetical protein